MWVAKSHSESLRCQYREIFRFVRRRTASVADAEDLTQEVFANAAASLRASADAAAPTLRWLYVVARRRLVDEARRRRLDAVSLELVAGLEQRERAYGDAVARALEQGLERLAAEQRAVVVMRLLQGRSFGEISRVVGVSEAACRMRFKRGLEQLQIELTEEGLEP